MNAARRQHIEQIRTKLEELACEIDTLIEAEQEAFDNLPESLQSGDKGDKMQEAISDLESARSNIEDAGSQLESAAS